MKKSKSVSFAELRHLMSRLGYAVKRAKNASIFHRSGEHFIILRLYDEAEKIDERDLRTTRRFLDAWSYLPVAERDLRTTRMFLDAWGYLEADDFDTALRQATTPA
jgi:hypothetical protein